MAGKTTRRRKTDTPADDVAVADTEREQPEQEQTEQTEQIEQAGPAAQSKAAKAEQHEKPEQADPGERRPATDEQLDQETQDRYEQAKKSQLSIRDLQAMPVDQLHELAEEEPVKEYK